MAEHALPDMHDIFRFVSRLTHTAKRGARAAMARCPKCHFGMLENLHILIAQHGKDDAIYVSEIARRLHQPMPAVSRGLRAMEQEGCIVRQTDPADRRKTLVRITPQGQQALRQNEAALNDYIVGVISRLTPEQMKQMHTVCGALLDAVEAENAARKPATNLTK